MSTVDRDEVPVEPTDEVAPPDHVVVAAAPEVVAQSLGEYVHGWWLRIKSGDSGPLPVVVGIVAISIYFQTQNSAFLSAGNLTNLLVQGAAIILLGMGETFALLLGEIDLSIGWVSGIGGVVMVELLLEPSSWPWWAAVLAGIVTTTAIGLLQGTLITRLRLPSFVVTLAGMLAWQGVMIIILGQGGTKLIPSNIVNDFAGGNMSALAGWIVTAVVVLLLGGLTVWRDTRRRRAGLTAPPPSLTAIKVALMAAAGLALLLVCNTDRGTLVAIRGIPWVVPIVLVVFAAWSILLGRTRFGRYVYAVGGNAEAARRAGINLTMVRTVSFGLAGLTAGIAGIIYASRLQSVSTSLDSSLVLYAVASAVIGGTSLFGGRGRPINALLGGVVIAAIYNGMGLLGKSAAAQYIVMAIVLLAAVTVDALARRGRSAV